MSQQDLRNELKHYFKQIKSLFPRYGKYEKRFMQDLMAGIDGYIVTNPKADINEVISHFGTPKDIIKEYLGDVDTDYLLAQIRRTKIIKICITIIIILAITATAIFAFLQYQHFKEARDAYISREEVILGEF